MTRLDFIPPSLTYPSVPHFERGPTNRLIVLFPAQAADSPNQSRRIWEIATSFGLSVLLLSLCDDYYEESQLRRQLITMAALVGDSHICADIRIDHGSDWLGSVRKIYRPGDVIACYAGQRVGLMQKPLHEILRLQWDATIYVLSADEPIKNSKPKFISQVAFWLGALAIVGSFLWLEVNMVQLPQDWAHNFLFYLCVFVEIGILWFWNSFFT